MSEHFDPTPPGSGGKADVARRQTKVQGSKDGTQDNLPGGAQPTDDQPSSGSSPATDSAPPPAVQPPPPPPAARPVEDQAAMIARLQKQVSDKTSKIGDLSVSISDLQRNLADVGRKLGEAEDNCRQTEQRRADLAAQLSEERVRLTANSEALAAKVEAFNIQLQTAWAEKAKVDQELAKAKVANPDMELPSKLEVTSRRIGELETELASASAAKAATDAELAKVRKELSEAKAEAECELKAAKDKATTDFADAEKEADERLSSGESRIAILELQLRETQEKYWAALREGKGLAGDYLKQIEVLKQELVAAEAEKKRAITAAIADVIKAKGEVEAALADMQKKFSEAGWFADGSSVGNGAARQPTTTTAAVPADKPGLVKRLFGRKDKNEEEM